MSVSCIASRTDLNSLISFFRFPLFIGKHNRCSCGNLIVHVKNDDDCQPRSPRHQAVFNRLYRHRLTKELHHRKLAVEQIEKEARECTYIPLTNNVRREVESTSSLTSIAHREQRIEQAREQFNQGKMCIECLKEVEISTGTFILGEDVRNIFARDLISSCCQIMYVPSLTLHVLVIPAPRQ